jgi:hypothetical protein
VSPLHSRILITAALSLAPSLVMAQDAPKGTWTASIRPSLSMSGNIGSSTKRMYGSIKIVPSKSGQVGTWDIDLHLTNDRPSETLMWTISPGRCGSGAYPLALPNELPFLEVSANSTADLTANVKLVLAADGSYHLDIYRGGNQQDNVIACALLKYNAPK